MYFSLVKIVFQVLMVCGTSMMTSRSHAKHKCIGLKEMCWDQATTPETIHSTSCVVSSDSNSALVYVVIAFGILLAGGIGFHVYVFYCRNTGHSLGREEYKRFGFKTRTSSRLVESVATVQTGPPTETSLTENDKQTTKTSEEPPQVTMEYSADQKYVLPDPTPASTYASLYSSVDVDQKKPEENEDAAAPRIPSPYHKGEPIVYATIDKTKKKKTGSGNVEAVYAKIRKSHKNDKDST